MIVLYIINIVVIVVLLGVLINGVEEYNKNTITIPFIEFKHLEYPVVQFYAPSGEKLAFLIDSGSNLSYISNEAIKKLTHAPTECTIEVKGACSTDSEIVSLYNAQLKYDKSTFTNTFGLKTFNFKDFEGKLGVPIDGILGSLFFDRYNMIIDYKNYRIMVIDDLLSNK